MYLAHYNLNKFPFKTNPDPRFLWFGESHREALSVLKYGILKSEGFILLTGDIGTGKTSLIRHLVKLIKDKAFVAFVPIPNMAPIDFFNFLSEEFRMKGNYPREADFLIEFKRFLLTAHSNHKKVFLIVDEAQNMNHELLEKIRLLSNIELDNRKLINIFFVGQKETENVLMQEKNKAIRQRITTACRLHPLNELETKKYIAHRLKIAGANKNMFTSDACGRIHSISNGVPRLINSICDCALLSGYVRGKKVVDSSFVEECQIDLRIPIGDLGSPGRRSLKQGLRKTVRHILRRLSDNI
jgi:general secretion pathway protein A